jgi:Domain of unknown function (DUF4157)
MGDGFAPLSNREPAPTRLAAPAGLAGSLGSALPSATRLRFEALFDTDFSAVRVHHDSTSAQLAERLNARAWTAGSHIVFGAQAWAPGTSAGDHLIAHELAHVAQHVGADGPAAGSQGDVEAEATSVAHDALQGRRVAIAVAAGPGPHLQTHDDDQPNPIATWRRSPGSVLLISTPGRLMVLPGSELVLTPPVSPEQLAAAPAHLDTDLGALFSVPATGASATRVFRAGRRTAMILDAGTGSGVRGGPAPANASGPAAVYLDQLQAVMASMGLSQVSNIRAIHVHSDHVSEIAEIVLRYGVLAANVVIPQPFLNTNAAIREVVRTLQNTTDPRARLAGFGTGWRPGAVLRDRGGPGDVFRASYSVGDLSVETVALRSALANVAANPDLASYLTKVTRTTDQAKVVVLGDLRGRDLTAIEQAMNAQRAGSFAEFFSGVSTLSGFSHHAGALEDRDLPGIMSLLDATLLANGRLRVVEQTNTRSANTRQTRSDTLELLSRLGVEVAYTDRPVGQGASRATATRDSVSSAGPDARVQVATNSALTQGIERMERLEQARRTMEAWQPWADEIGPQAGRFFAEMITESANSAQQLRSALRPAVEAAARVRSGGARIPTGGRDYSAAGGARGAAFQAALTAIPTTTPAETRLGTEGFRGLQQLRETPIERMPARIALYRALHEGTYSDVAFQEMLRHFSPAEQREMVRTPIRNASERVAAFRRVRAEYNFRRSTLGDGESWSIPRNWGPGGRRGGAGVVWFQLALELWTDVVEPLLQAHETSTQVFRGENLLPFVRRLAFWNTVGVMPKMVGIDDPTFGSPRYTTGVKAVTERLRSNPFDALIFDRPGIETSQVLQLAAFLSSNVRNYDEFATLFRDSGQDAVDWSGPGAWEQATWRVHVGYYNTSGTNRVAESWYDHPELTALMRHVVPVLIANTERLLDLRRGGGGPDAQTEARIGRLEAPNAVQRTAALATPATSTRVLVATTGGSPGFGAPAHDLLERDVTWSTPPQFFVHDVSGENSLVSGADFNTYAVIRDLLTEHHEIGTAGNLLNAVYRTVVGNEEGTVWIRTRLLTAQQPAARPTAPAPRSNSGPSSEGGRGADGGSANPTVDIGIGIGRESTDNSQHKAPPQAPGLTITF